jgi:hypothetical protein
MHTQIHAHTRAHAHANTRTHVSLTSHTICNEHPGDNNSKIAIVEFSTNSTCVRVPLKPRGQVDTLSLRAARQCQGGIDTAAAIGACLNELPDKSEARTHQPAIVLLAGGSPDGKARTRALAAATEAKRAGVAVLTVGVRGAGPAFLGELSSGPGYAFSAAASNGAAKLWAKVAAALCGVQNEGASAVKAA